jgi:hypothetical protein
MRGACGPEVSGAPVRDGKSWWMCWPLDSITLLHVVNGGEGEFRGGRWPEDAAGAADPRPATQHGLAEACCDLVVVLPFDA